MSETNNNTPMRITQLEEATAYEDGMYYAVAKAGTGTKKIGASVASPEDKTIRKMINEEIGFSFNGTLNVISLYPRVNLKMGVKKDQEFFVRINKLTGNVASVRFINDSNSQAVFDWLSIDHVGLVCKLKANQDADNLLATVFLNSIPDPAQIDFDFEIFPTTSIIDYLIDNTDNVPFIGFSHYGEILAGNTYPYVETGISLSRGERFLFRINNVTGNLSGVSITNAAGNNVVNTQFGTSSFGVYHDLNSNIDVSNVRVIAYLNSVPETKRIDLDFELIPYRCFYAGYVGKLTSELNSFVGTTSTYGVKIDTANHIITMGSGIWIPKTGKYIYLASNISIDYTDFSVNPNNSIVDICVDARNNQLEIHTHDITQKDHNYIVLFTIYTNTGWNIEATKVYPANSFMTEIIYLNGAKLKPDTESLFNTNIHTARIFKKVVCIGDSYTEGYIVDSQGTVHAHEKEYSWVNYISKSTGNNWINCGVTGATSISYQSSGLPYALQQGKTQAYVIGLMINDINSSTDSVPLGTPEDIGTESQTYYGAMSKIIRELHEESPDAFIFVNTCPKTYGSFPSYNEAVRTICSTYQGTYKTHCIDLAANIGMYQNASFINDANNGHYSAVGYEQMAEIYEIILSNYINQSPLAFRDVPFIDYDE